VGVCLAVLVDAAVVLGAMIRLSEISRYGGMYAPGMASPVPTLWTGDAGLMLALTAMCLILGATVSWPLWTLLVRLFLPANLSAMLLDWQRGLSRAAPGLARE
jgi:hypothetical protein